MERELRKQQDTLISTGLGVIAFGIWSIVKGFFYFTLKPEIFTNARGYDTLNGTERIIMYVFIGVLLLTDLIVRIIIGRAAIKEGKGLQKRKGYIVLAILVVLTTFYTFILGITQWNDIDKFEYIISSFVEITNLIILVEMIVAAIKVKNIRKGLEA